MAKTRRTIDANGNLVTLTTAAAATATSTTENNNSVVVSSSSAAGNLISSLQSMETFNVFGHNVPARQFWIGLALIAFVFGLRGVCGFFMARSLYNLYYMRSNSGTTAATSSSSSSGGGRLGGGAGGGGSNIRGMSDLPCDPKVG